MAVLQAAFLVAARRDPIGANLDRIQIVKGWSKSGQSFEKVFDVVWAGDRKAGKWSGKIAKIGSTVDVDNASYTNWELSTDRANAVRSRLELVGVARERVRVEGYADTVPLPEESLEGLPIEERLARHRRVIVRIY